MAIKSANVVARVEPDIKEKAEAIFETLGIPDAAGIDLRMTDVMTGEEFGVKREFVDLAVPKHDCRVFRCTPVAR